MEAPRLGLLAVCVQAPDLVGLLHSTALQLHYQAQHVCVDHWTVLASKLTSLWP